MPSLSGNLVDVTSAPSDATEVWIRAADGRVNGANVVLEETRRVPVTGGKFTVNVLPGRAHLVVIHAGMSQEHVPLLVQDGMTTIAEAVRLGAADWEEYSPSEAEQIKSELAAEVTKAATSAQDAKAAQQAAEQARTDTQNALSTKADKVHTHALGDVTGLQAALNGKANTSHTHTTAQVTGLDSALADKAETTHTHALADVTGLQAALNGKASTSHTHTTAQVTGLDTALAGKAAQADMVALQTRLAGIMPRSYDLRPVSDQTNVMARIVAGKRPGDTDTEIKIPAGVYLIVVEYPKEIWYSIYGPDGKIVGEDGPVSARMVRAVISKPGVLKVFTSAPAAEQATTTLSLTIIPGQAPV